MQRTIQGRIGNRACACAMNAGAWFRRLLLAACLFVYSQSAPAALPDPAVELQRQQQRERELRKGQEPSPDVRLPQAAVPLGLQAIPEEESPCFLVSRISLVGDTAEPFRFALKSVTEGDDPALGHCLGSQGINVVLARVQNAIIARGYVTTRVLAAPQDLKTGELTLTVIPGRIREIRFVPDPGSRGTYWNALPARPGDLLNLRDIEQALENHKRPPTADADIRIEPAGAPDAKPGESDVVIRYRQAFPFRLTLSADDGGSKTTGKYQGGVTLSADNLLALNDLFYFSLNNDLGGGDTGERGTRGHTVHFSLPFGYWLLGITGSQYRYHQSVAGLNQTYLYSGESSNGEIKLARIFYRDGVRKTGASVLGYLKTSRNYIDDTEVLVQRRRMAGWQAALVHREFMGQATLDLNLAYRRGTGMLDAMPAPEEAFGEGTARPRIATAEAGLHLPFTIGGQRLRYVGNGRAQWNYTPLIPQDRFSIGGRYTVRGFDGESVLSAERGWLIRNDLGLMLGNSGQELYLGLDSGHVSGPSSGLLPGKGLVGSVLGLRGGYKGMYWDVFTGTPFDKPNGFKAAKRTAGFNLSWTY